ncbi:MAG: hypothetical protein AB7V42_07545 [Thermoleophilia bacterium]
MSAAGDQPKDGFVMEVPTWDAMPRIGWDDFMAARVRFLDRVRGVDPAPQDAVLHQGDDGRILG